jgi:hypothetical protein
MSASVLARPREIFPIAPPGLILTPVGASLWRVARTRGPVLGHVERREVDGVDRYVARRLLRGGVRSMDLGAFWSAADAIECFR